LSSSDRVQTVRNAWINRVRDEALRMRRPEVSKAFHVGMLIATYADADGGNAFPSRTTLAGIAGCTEETVTRCVKLLVAVGLLEHRRRPNKPAVYQLLIPLERPDWDAHMHVWGESRQAKARRLAKEKEIAELLAVKVRTASGDVVREASGDAQQTGSESVPGGVSGQRPRTPSEEPGKRPRTPPDSVLGRLPESVPGGGDQYLPTSGRNPQRDHETADHSRQPQTPAGAREKNHQSPAQETPPPLDFTRCTRCGDPMVPRPGRTTHTHCTTPAPPATERTAHDPTGAPRASGSRPARA
jgi:hypothetical protein